MLGLFDDKKQIYSREFYIDELTGALNRRYLNLIVDREIQRSRRYKHKFSILIADLDNFKTINDTFGHLAGDRALRFFAKNIKDSLRSADSVIRYGGDEFIIIMPNTDIDGAKKVGERILTLLKNQEFEGMQLSASIGVATFPEHGNSWEEVFQAADQALYTSKRLGKARVSTPERAIKNLILPTKYLIGRREETSWITARTKNTGIFHIIKGEVGIGKTRLVLETINKLNIPFAYARSMGPLKDVSYFLIRDLLNNLLKHHRDHVFSAFDHLPDNKRVEIGKFMPDIFKQYAKTSSTGDKYTLYESLITFLNLLNFDKLLLIFDDLQWIDKESAEFVHYIIEKQLNSLVFFGIYRIEEVEKSPIYEVITLLSRMRYIDELFLKPLSPEETYSMLNAALGTPPEKELLDIIYEETGGNPFFIEEILRKLYEENWIYFKDNTWYLRKNYKISPSQNIEQLVDRKLQQLSERERLVLDYASVYGRELDAMILSRASGLNEGEVFDILDKLVRLNILKEGTISDYVFMEGVIRDIVEKRLSRGKLKYYHRVIAKAIEEMYSATLKDHYEELVHHYEISGNLDRMRYYAKLAGDKAFELYAFEKALLYYKKALDGLPPDEDVFNIHRKIIECYKNLGQHREAIQELKEISEIYKNHLFTIFESIADSYIRLGEWYNAIEYYKKAIEHSEKEEDRYHVEVEMAWALVNLGEHKEAQDILDKALEYFKTHGDEEHKKIMFIWIYTNLATMANMNREFEKAVTYYKKALHYSEELNHHYNIAVSHLNIGIALSSMDKIDEALEHYSKALQIAQKDNYFYLLATILQNIGLVYAQKGDFKNALKYYSDCENRFKIMRNKYNLMLNYLNLVDVYLNLNELSRAKEMAKIAGELARELNTKNDILYSQLNLVTIAIKEKNFNEALAILYSINLENPKLDRVIKANIYKKYGEIYLATKDYKKALSTLLKASTTLEDTSQNVFELTETYFLISRAYYNLGSEDKATEYLEKALSLENSISNEFKHALLRHELAKTLFDKGEKEKAKNILKELLNYFEKIGATLLANEVKSLLN